MEDLYKLHLDLFVHYSNLIYRTRIIIVAFIILIWAIYFGVGIDLNIILGNEEVNTKRRLICFAGSFLISFLVMLKSAYINRMKVVLKAGMVLEECNKNDKTQYFFYQLENNKPIIVWPFLAFYFINILFFLYNYYTLKNAHLFLIVLGILNALICFLGSFWLIRKDDFIKITQKIRKR